MHIFLETMFIAVFLAAKSALKVVHANNVGKECYLNERGEFLTKL